MPGQLTGIRQLKDLGWTIEDTLRIPLAEITFRGHSKDGVQRDRPYRADVDTHGTADAEVLLHQHHPIRLGAMQCPRGADVDARRVLTVHAGDGDVFPFSQSDDLDPATPGVPYLVMVKGTDQFTHAAAAADALRIIPIFEITYPLPSHLIHPKQNRAAPPYPRHGVALSAG